MISRLFMLLTLATHIVARPTTKHNIVQLDYGSFQGGFVEDLNITYWEKIPFAAPPVGGNRFRAPQPPLVEDGIYNSTQPFDMCPQDQDVGTEDCLYLGLYGRPWKQGDPLRPVVVAFHGGGFIRGGASFEMPETPRGYPILNVSDSEVMFLYPQYRLNAFGFLPGKELGEDDMSDLNVGLLDQVAALEWTQKYIHLFGGDPDNVTIWGQSAGGSSVIAHTISTKKNKTPLFKQAMASSPYWPKVYRYDSSDAQSIYDDLVKLTGCEGSGSLHCLKELDFSEIRAASYVLNGSHTFNTSSYTWSPVIDDEFLGKSLTESTTGTLGTVENIVSIYTTYDGEHFVPTSLRSDVDSGTPPFNSSEASFNKWLRGFLPGFSELQLSMLKDLYPESGSTGLATYKTSFARAGLIYRDLVLACPALWFASSSKKGQWLGQYTVLPAEHGGDGWWWNNPGEGQEADELHYKGYMGAFKSYFTTGDPNAVRLLPDIQGAPTLRSGSEWVVDEEGFSKMDPKLFKRRCLFWRDMSADIPV